MKKTLFGVMLLLIIGTTQLTAQVSGGVKAEANVSNFILSKVDGKSKMNIGATIGGFAKIDITNNFALQPEMLFHFQNSKFKNDGIKRNYEYWGMEIPVYLMGQWYTKTESRLYAGIAPYVGLGFQAKYDHPKTKLYKTDAHQQWDFGFRALAGYEFTNKIQINAGYKIGVINATDKDPGKMYSQAVSLGIGYRF